MPPLCERERAVCLQRAGDLVSMGEGEACTARRSVKRLAASRSAPAFADRKSPYDGDVRGIVTRQVGGDVPEHTVLFVRLLHFTLESGGP